MDNIMDDIFTTSVHIGQRRLILLMFVHTPGTYICTTVLYNNTTCTTILNTYRLICVCTQIDRLIDTYM